MDFVSVFKNGFGYGKQTIYSDENNKGIVDMPIFQVGKYKGDFPMEILLTGEYDNVPFSKIVDINSNDVFAGDSSVKLMWVGNYIKSAEPEYYNSWDTKNNSNAADIVKISIENRVLSMYTAFLALEPNDTIKICQDCEDNNSTANENDKGNNSNAIKEKNKNIENEQFIISAMPNPFNSTTTINIGLPENNAKILSVEIYNSLGQVVKNFNIKSLNRNSNNEIQIQWNGSNDNGDELTNGIYFMIANTSAGKKSVKLALMK